MVVPFRDLVGNPRVWQETAHDLVHAANLLLKSYRDRDATTEPVPTWRTILMLYGLAAENLIKAILVAKGPNPAGTEGRLPQWFTSHNLAALARRAGLPVSEFHEHRLTRLQQFVECGKYPVGLREGEGRATFVFSEPIDVNDTLQLVEYLEEELEAASGGFAPASLKLQDLRAPWAKAPLADDPLR